MITAIVDHVFNRLHDSVDLVDDSQIHAVLMRELDRMKAQQYLNLAIEQEFEEILRQELQRALDHTAERVIANRDLRTLMAKAVQATLREVVGA